MKLTKLQTDEIFKAGQSIESSYSKMIGAIYCRGYQDDDVITINNTDITIGEYLKILQEQDQLFRLGYGF